MRLFVTGWPVGVGVRVRLPRHEKLRVHRDVEAGVRQEAAVDPGAVAADRDVDVGEEAAHAGVDDEDALRRLVEFDRRLELEEVVHGPADDLDRRRASGRRRAQREDAKRRVGRVRAGNDVAVGRREHLVERAVLREHGGRRVRPVRATSPRHDEREEAREGGSEAADRRERRFTVSSGG